VHSERGLDQPIVEPHVEEVESYERLVQNILNPPTIMSKAIPAARIFSVNYGDNLFEVIKQMNDRVYTHAPVLKNGRVEGVFSENAVFSYLGHHGEAILDSTLTIEVFRDFLPVESHSSECFQFVSRHSSLEEVAQMFVEALSNRRRLGAILFT
jgi:predicted transcriptional regulator